MTLIVNEKNVKEMHRKRATSMYHSLPLAPLKRNRQQMMTYSINGMT